MKRIKVIITVAVSVFSIYNIYAQPAYNLPQNLKFTTTLDYEKYEPDIIAAAKWLEETDLNKETGKRKDINAFVSQWIIGTPVVSVRLSAQLQEIYGKNGALMIIYIASYSSYYILNKSEATEFAATKAGLKSIMFVYQKRIDIKKSKEMERLIKATAENKLDVYISDKFNLKDTVIKG